MIRLRLIHPFAAVAAIVVCVTLASDRATSAGTFDDFRVPEHHVLQWTGFLGGTAGWGSGFRSDRSEWSGSGSGNAMTQASGLAESDAALTTWSAYGSAYGNRSHDTWRTEPADVPYWEGHESWGHSLSESFALGMTRRWWPSRSPAHLVAAASATGDYGQDWTWTRSDWAYHFTPDPSPVRREEAKAETRTWDHRLSAAAGAGIGRTRDATGAYEAQLLEDRLREAGLLAKPLSATARRDLAALLAVRGDVASTHDHPAAIVWGEIHRILTADGALRDGAASAESWFHLTEPWAGRFSRVDQSLVPVSPVLRLRGWMLEARVEGRTGEYVNHWSNAYSSFVVGDPPPLATFSGRRDATCEDRAVAGLAGEGHWPLGMRVQADASASALADLRPGQHGIDQRADAAANWMATPRWLATLTLAQRRECFTGRGLSLADDTWQVLYGLTGEYFVTDHLDATLRFTQTHVRSVSYARPGNQVWEIDNKGQVVFGLTYRFAGRMSAPGLFPTH